MDKHTPGPWMLDGLRIIGRENLDYAQKYGVELGGSSKALVATVSGITIERRINNALLLVAAPDLLAASLAALECLEEAALSRPLTVRELQARSGLRSSITKARRQEDAHG